MTMASQSQTWGDSEANDEASELSAGQHSQNRDGHREGDKGQQPPALPPASFQSLPDEMHLEILETLTNYYDVLSLACGCIYMWNLAQPRLQFIFELGKKEYTWAGSRIALMGDYAQSLPPTLPEPENVGIDLESLGEGWGDSVYAHITSNFKLAPFSASFSSPQNNTWLKCVEAYPSAIRPFLKPSFRLPLGTNFVLRNLTTKEYIQWDLIAQYRDELGGREGNMWSGVDVGFSQILNMQIGWSDDPSISMATSVDLHLGPWSGHRFDITTSDSILEPHASDVDGSPWTDVSTKLAGMLARVIE